MKALYPQSNFPDTYNFLEKIFNNVSNGIAILGLDGEWLKVNNFMCSLLGYTKDEIFNMNIKDILYREDLGVHKGKYENLISGKTNQYRVEQRYFRKNGDLIWVLVSVSLIRDQDNNPYNVIWQFTDITKRKRQKAKLKMMLNVAREQNERLTAFADIITHNLRSHSGNLNTITQFLEEDYIDLLDNENYQLLKSAIGNLEQTVSHLTEVAKTKQVDESEIKALNLYDYSEKAIYNIAAIARHTNTDIINEVRDHLYVRAIPAYLDSILLNFLSNAIKYRSNKRLPKIRLTSEVHENYVVLTIKDNGLGIDLKKHGDKLFQMYKTFHYNEDAIGVGLFITKNHIESLGGKVLVKSEVGVGSEFSVYFKQA